MGIPVGRLAPSPTGRLHLGHARSFLAAWWQARRLGGRIVLRLEDLDVARATREYTDDILTDLEWLGLDWDGPPIVQSGGVAAILEFADRLVEMNAAYPCVCQRAEILSAQGAPHAGDAERRYPGTCRDRFTSLAEAERATGRPAGLRFRAPAGAVSFVDGIAGPMAIDVQATVGDFLITRKDRSPAYQLAVVVDDAVGAVTHVLRGEDLLPSTARQILLYEALGLPSPHWFHLPLVCDATGRRLAKRSDDLSLTELRARGVDPRVLVGWIAATCGVDAPPRISATDVVALFDVERIPKRRVCVDDAVIASWLDRP